MLPAGYINFASNNYTMTSIKWFCGALMFVLAVTCLVFIVAGLQKVLRKNSYFQQRRRRILTITVFVITAWLVITGILAIKGFFTNFAALPPRPAVLILLPLPFVLIIAFSKKATPLLKAVPPQWLIAMQTFRIAVELLLFYMYTANLLPKQMTFEGGNLDILSGLLAIPAALAISKKYRPVLVWLYNIAGLLLLLNILVIAVLSMPLPFRRFMVEPGAAIIGRFPFMYLPGVLVVIAYSLHIVSLRQVALLSAKKG